MHDHLIELSKVLVKDNPSNIEYYEKIIDFFPDEITSLILKFFIERSVKKAPNVYINKEELEMVTNPVFKDFDKSLKTTLGIARAHARLDILVNCLIRSCFQESYYDLVDIFIKQIGFRPTECYISKLKQIFSDHRIVLFE